MSAATEKPKPACHTMGNCEDSDEEDLLNFQPFSTPIKPSTIRTVKKCVNETTPPTKSTNSSHSAERDYDAGKNVQKEAKRISQTYEFPSWMEIKPSTLFWRVDRKNRKTVSIYPCRECDPSEATGLNLADWNEKKQTLIQLIKHPGPLAEREIVYRSCLLPYYQAETKAKLTDATPCSPGDSVGWNSDNLLRYKKQILKRKGTTLDCEVMDLLLQRILRHSREQEQKENDVPHNGEDGEEAKEEEEDEGSASRKCALVLVSPIEEKGKISDLGGSAIIIGQETHKSSISIGCQIQYYHIMCVYGDKRGLRRAKVLEIKSRKEKYPLVLDTGDLVPMDSKVKLLPGGPTQQLSNFKFRKSKLSKTVAATGIKRKANEMSIIVRNARDNFHKAVDGSDMDLKDILHSYRGADRVKTNDSAEGATSTTIMTSHSSCDAASEEDQMSAILCQATALLHESANGDCSEDVPERQRRRRSTAEHMTKAQLKLARLVKAIMAIEWETVAKGSVELEEEIEVASSQLEKFLEGDPHRLVRQDMLKTIAQKLRSWLRSWVEEKEKNVPMVTQEDSDDNIGANTTAEVEIDRDDKPAAKLKNSNEDENLQFAHEAHTLPRKKQRVDALPCCSHKKTDQLGSVLHMTAEQIELAEEVQSFIREKLGNSNGTTMLAKELGITANELQIFLDGIAQKGHEETESKLRQWLNKTREVPKPDLPKQKMIESVPTETPAAKSISGNQTEVDSRSQSRKRKLADLEQAAAVVQSKRRRSTPHMSIAQLELAEEVDSEIKKIWKSSEVGIATLAEELDITENELQKFLDGDPHKLIRRAVLNETQTKLSLWLNKKTRA